MGPENDEGQRMAAARRQKNTRSITVLDGGMSRELIRLNAPFRQPEWSALSLIEAPHLVKQAHKEFAAAGADVLTVNSYALVPFHIGQERFEKQGEELAALAGRLAREAADEEKLRTGREVLVAGSLPPIFGSYRPDLFDATHVQIYLKILVRGLAPYVDIWLGETLSLIAEAEAVMEAVKGTSRPVWIAFTLADNDLAVSSDPRLRSGERVEDAVVWASSTSVEAILFNCSQAEFMMAAVQQANLGASRRTQRMRIGVYANAFVPKQVPTAANEGISEVRSDLDSISYSAISQQWIVSGASIIGGCCGIGCEHISQIAQAVRSTAT